MMNYLVKYSAFVVTCILVTLAYGSGISVNINAGKQDNPSWLVVEVNPTDDNVYSIIIRAEKRKNIVGYDLRLSIDKGSMKGLYIPVEVVKAKPGYSSVISLPSSALDHAKLILSEQLGAEDGS